MKKWLFLMPVTSLVLAALVLGGCGQGASRTITEAGSTTVQPLAEKLAAVFMQKNPGVTITIQGGGSSVGIKSAADGTVDIGAASRELNPDEPKLVKHLLAKDGIAIVVHPSNHVNGLTKDQIIKVFAGEITNWSELGGSSGTITVVSREEGSGTRGAFEEMVMGKTLITDKAILQPSNGALRTSVSTTPLAIGFLSLGYVDNTVKALAVNGVACTQENCKSGEYPIVRPLYFLTKEQPTGLVKAFLDFCTSSEGQKIVQDEGYLSIK
jgi:phosphate transport system substrate-binding protein